MDKFKKYLKYALLLVLLFIFVSIMSKLIIISMYKPKECKVLFENPKIEIIDSKATNANGYIYGCITNTTGSTIENKFIKLDCYSEYDNNINNNVFFMNRIIIFYININIYTIIFIIH